MAEQVSPPQKIFRFYKFEHPPAAWPNWAKRAAFFWQQGKKEQGFSRGNAGKSQEDSVFFDRDLVAAADFRKNMGSCQTVPKRQGDPRLSCIGRKPQRAGFSHRKDDQIVTGVQYMNFDEKHLLGEDTRKGV